MNMKSPLLFFAACLPYLGVWTNAQFPLQDDDADRARWSFRKGEKYARFGNHHKSNECGEKFGPGQDTLKYWTRGPYLLAGGNYQHFFLRNLGPNQSSISTIDPCEIYYVRYDAIKEQVQTNVIEWSNRTARRSDNLGFLRMNNKVDLCQDETDLFSDGYCGIALGITPDDHDIIRPPLDELLGDSLSPDGDISATSGVNDRWTSQELRESAKKFIEARNRIDLKHDVELWVLQTMHKIIFKIDMSEDEATALAKCFNRKLQLGILPARLFLVPGFRLAARRLRKHMKKYVDKYDGWLRQLVVDGDIASLNNADKEIRLLSSAIYDALALASLPALTVTIKGALGAYYLGWVGDQYNMTDTMDLSLVILEGIRNYPPVLGFPRVDVATGIRHMPLVGISGYDSKVYGSDALTYRIRLSLDDYKDTLLNWADAATALPGKPESAHQCPAKALSFQMVLAFLMELDATQWKPNFRLKDPGPGNGPFFWRRYTIRRKNRHGHDHDQE